MAKWYGMTPEDFTSTEPELWIYDESLLQPSTRPAELTWRIEVTPKDGGMPVRELVLVNAQRGGISLHFNQVDTAWPATGASSNSQHAESEGLAGTLYVASTGNDSNLCDMPAAACATINGAISKAASGDTIKVAEGIYTGSGTEVVLLNKTVSLSGGWDPSFTSQAGYSTIDGQGARRGVRIVAADVDLTNFKVQNCVGSGVYIGSQSAGVAINHSMILNNRASSGGGINNFGSLVLNNSTISGNTATYQGGGFYNGDNLTLQ